MRMRLSSAGVQLRGPHLGFRGSTWLVVSVGTLLTPNLGNVTPVRLLLLDIPCFALI